MNYELKELHSALLILLKKFDAVCQENGIKYSVGYGTMLGAIRHRGFIPWDDDVDVIISRKEYEKLIMLPKEVYGTDFFFQTVDTDLGYPYNTSRLRLNNSAMTYEKWVKAKFHQGIYIDIIVYDNIPNFKLTELWQKLQIIILTPCRFAMNKDIFFSGGKNIPIAFKKITYMLIKKLPLKKLYRLEVKIEKKYSNMKVDRIGFLGEGNLFLKKWYPAKPVRAKTMTEFYYVEFEDTKLMCSKYYDELLRQWYGDYMALPPREERTIYHSPLFFSATKSYTEYLREVNRE